MIWQDKNDIIKFLVYKHMDRQSYDFFIHVLSWVKWLYPKISLFFFYLNKIYKNETCCTCNPKILIKFLAEI